VVQVVQVVAVQAAQAKHLVLQLLVPLIQEAVVEVVGS
jgi:hypothetical protein